MSRRGGIPAVHGREEVKPKAVSVNLFRWYWRIPIVLMARRRARQDDARAAWIASLTAHNQLGWGCCPHQVCPECEDDRW